MPGRRLRTERVVLSDRLVVNDPRAIDYEERALKFKQSINFSLRTSELQPDLAVKAAIALPEADPNDTDGRKREFSADSRPGIETDPRGNRWESAKTYEPGDRLVLFPSYSSRTSIGTEPNFGWIKEPQQSFSSFEDMLQFIKKKPQVKLTKYKVNPKTGEADESSGVELDQFSIPSGLSLDERRDRRNKKKMQTEQKMLGRSLRERMPGGSLIARVAAIAGVLIDERNKFRCPPGTPAASQYTDRMGSNCFGFSASRFARYAQRQARELYPEDSKLRNTVRNFFRFHYTGYSDWMDSPEEWARTPLYDATTGEPIPHPDWRDASVPPEQRWLRGAMASAQDQIATTKAEVLGLQTMLGVDTSDVAKETNQDLWQTYDRLNAAGIWDIRFEFDNGINARPNPFQVEQMMIARLQSVPGWDRLTDAERRALIKADVHRYYLTERAFLEGLLKKFIDEPEMAKEIAFIQYRATGQDESSTGFITDAAGRLRATLTLDINKIMTNQESMLPNMGPNERLAITAAGAVSEAEGMSAVSDFLHSSNAAARQMSGLIDGAYSFTQHIAFHEYWHVATGYAVLQRAREEILRTGKLEIPTYKNGKFVGMKVVTSLAQLNGSDLMTLMKGGAREVDPRAIDEIMKRTNVAAFLAGSYPREYKEDDAVYFLEVIAELGALRDMGLLTGEELDAVNKALEWVDGGVARLVEDRRKTVEAEEAAKIEAESYSPDIDIDPATVTPEELDEIHRRELSAETKKLREASKKFDEEMFSAVERGDGAALVSMSADPALGVYTLVPLMDEVQKDINELTDGGKIKEADMSPDQLKELKKLQQKEKLLLLQHNVYKEAVRKARYQYSKNFTPAGGRSGNLIFDANVRDELLRTRGLDIEEVKKKVKEGIPLDSVLDLEEVKADMRAKHGEKTPKKLVSLITDKMKQRSLVKDKESDEYLQLSTEINELSEIYVKRVKLDGDKRSAKAIRAELDELVESGSRPKPKKTRKFKSTADSNAFASDTRKATGRRLSKKERDAVKEIGDFRDAEVTQMLNPEEQVSAGRSMNRKNARLKKMGLKADPSSKDEGSMEEQVENILIPAMEAIDKTSASEPFEIEAVVDLDSSVTTGKVTGREVDIDGFTRGRTMPRGKSTIEGLPKPKKGAKNKTRVIVSVNEGDRGLFTYKERGDSADLFVMPPGRMRIIGKDDDGTIRVEFVQQKDTTEVLGGIASSIGEGDDDAAWRSGAKKKMTKIFDGYVASRGTSGKERAGTRSTDADEVKTTSKTVVGEVADAGGSFGSAPTEEPAPGPASGSILPPAPLPPGAPPGSSSARRPEPDTSKKAPTGDERRATETDYYGRTYKEFLDQEYELHLKKESRTTSGGATPDTASTPMSQEEWLDSFSHFEYDPMADRWVKPDLAVTHRTRLQRKWDEEMGLKRRAERGEGPYVPDFLRSGGRLSSGGTARPVSQEQIAATRDAVSKRRLESAEIRAAETKKAKTRVDSLKAALKELDETGVWQGEKYGVSRGLPKERDGIQPNLDAGREFGTADIDEWYRNDILEEKPDATPEEIAKHIEDGKKKFREDVVRKIEVAEKEIQLQEHIENAGRMRREQGLIDIEDIPEDVVEQLRAETTSIKDVLFAKGNRDQRAQIFEQPKDEEMIGVVHNGPGHLIGGVLDPQRTAGDEKNNNSAGSNVRLINLSAARNIWNVENQARGLYQRDRGLYDMVHAGLDEFEISDSDAVYGLQRLMPQAEFDRLLDDVRRTERSIRPDGSLPSTAKWPKVKKSSLNQDELKKEVERITPDSIAEKEKRAAKLKKLGDTLRTQGGQHMSAYSDIESAANAIGYNSRISGDLIPAEIAQLPDPILIDQGNSYGAGKTVIKDDVMYPRWATLGPRSSSYYFVGERDVDITLQGTPGHGEAQIVSSLKPLFGISVPLHAGRDSKNPRKAVVPREFDDKYKAIAPAIYARALRQYNRDGKIDVETVLSDPTLAPDTSPRLSSGGRASDTSPKLSSGAQSTFFREAPQWLDEYESEGAKEFRDRRKAMRAAQGTVDIEDIPDDEWDELVKRNQELKALDQAASVPFSDTPRPFAEFHRIPIPGTTDEVTYAVHSGAPELEGGVINPGLTRGIDSTSARGAGDTRGLNREKAAYLWGLINTPGAEEFHGAETVAEWKRLFEMIGGLDGRFMTATPPRHGVHVGYLGRVDWGIPGDTGSSPGKTILQSPELADDLKASTGGRGTFYVFRGVRNYTIDSAGILGPDPAGQSEVQLLGEHKPLAGLSAYPPRLIEGTVDRLDRNGIAPRASRDIRDISLAWAEKVIKEDAERVKAGEVPTEEIYGPTVASSSGGNASRLSSGGNAAAEKTSKVLADAKNLGVTLDKQSGKAKEVSEGIGFYGKYLEPQSIRDVEVDEAIKQDIGKLIAKGRTDLQILYIVSGGDWLGKDSPSGIFREGNTYAGRIAIAREIALQRGDSARVKQIDDFLAEIRKMTPEELRDAARSHMKNSGSFFERTPTVLTTDPSKILDSGRYETIHDGQMSMGGRAFDQRPDVRKSTEKFWLGMPEDAPNSVRPVSGLAIGRGLAEARVKKLQSKYGEDVDIQHPYAFGASSDDVLNSTTVGKGSMGGAFQGYGSNRIILKPEVAERTIAVAGDSIASQGNGVGIPLSRDNGNPDLTPFVNPLSVVFEARTGDRSSILSPSYNGLGRYSETLTIGGMDTGDIKAVITTSGDMRKTRTAIPIPDGQLKGVNPNASFTSLINFARERDRLKEQGIDLVLHDYMHFDVDEVEPFNPSMTQVWVQNQIDSGEWTGISLGDVVKDDKTTPYEALLRYRRQQVLNGGEAPIIFDHPDLIPPASSAGRSPNAEEVFVKMVDEELERLDQIKITERSRIAIEEMREITEEKSAWNQWTNTKSLFGVETKAAVKIPMAKPKPKNEQTKPDTRDTRKSARRKIINGIVKELKRISGGAVSKEYPGLTRADLDPRLVKMIINEPVEVITARLERNAMKMHLGFDRRVRIRISEDELTKFAKSGVLRFGGIPDEEQPSRRLQRISTMDPMEREARGISQSSAMTAQTASVQDSVINNAFTVVDMVKTAQLNLESPPQQELDRVFNGEVRVSNSPRSEDSGLLFETSNKSIAVALLMLGNNVVLSAPTGSVIPSDLANQVENGAAQKIEQDSPEWLKFSAENKPAGFGESIMPKVKQDFIDEYEIDFCSMPQAGANVLCASGISIDREDMPQLVGYPKDESSFVAKMAKSGEAETMWKSKFADDLDQLNEQIDEAIDVLEKADTEQNQLVVSALRSQKSGMQKNELRYRKIAARHAAPKTKIASAISDESASLSDAIEEAQDRVLRMEEIGAAPQSELFKLRDKITAMTERLDVLSAMNQGKPSSEDLEWFYSNTDWRKTLVDMQPTFVKYAAKALGVEPQDASSTNPLLLMPSQHTVKALTVNGYAQQMFDEAEIINDVLKNRGIYPGTEAYKKELARAISDNPIGSPIVVSSEGQIIDGHHKWAAIIIANESMPENEQIPVNVIRINASIVEALSLAKVFQDAVGLSSVRNKKQKKAAWNPSEIEEIEESSINAFIDKLASETKKKVDDIYESGHFIKIAGIGLPSRKMNIKRDSVSLMKSSINAYRETPINSAMSKKTIVAKDRREENGRKINKLRSMEAAIDGALKRSNIPQRHASHIKHAVFTILTTEQMPKIGPLTETAARIGRESGSDLSRLMLNELVSRKKITKMDRKTIMAVLTNREIPNLGYEMQLKIANAFRSALATMKDKSVISEIDSEPPLSLPGTRRIVGDRTSASIYGTKKDEDDEYSSGNNVNLSLNKMIREHFEKIGIPRTIDDEKLPITGYIVHRSHQKKKFADVSQKGSGSLAQTAVFEITDTDPAGDGLPAFGEIELVMKPGVSSRAAYSLGHSLSTGRIPVLLNSTEKDDIADAFIAGKSQKAKWANLESLVGLLMVDITNDYTHVNVGNVSVKQGPNKIFETLVLGGVDKDEVMQVNYPYSVIKEMAHSQNIGNVIDMDSVKKKLLLSQMNPAEIDRVLSMPTVIEKAASVKQIREYMAADGIRRKFKQLGFDNVKIAHPDGFDIFDPRSYSRSARPSDTVLNVLQAKFTEEVSILAQKQEKEFNRTGSAGILRK